MSTGRRAFLGTIGGFAAGFVVATLLHDYPKDQVTRHRYCQLCAEYEETYREGVILGARTESKSRFGGPLHRLLAEPVGEHEHRYTEWATIFPTFGVPNEHPEIAEQIRGIRELEDDPHAISALEQAMRQDEARTRVRCGRVALAPASTSWAALRVIHLGEAAKQPQCLHQDVLRVAEIDDVLVQLILVFRHHGDRHLVVAHQHPEASATVLATIHGCLQCGQGLRSGHRVRA